MQAQHVPTHDRTHIDDLFNKTDLKTLLFVLLNCKASISDQKWYWVCRM